jgi:hypothetical protein
MVVIDRVKEDFYQRISSDHVLVLVYPDVDSLCACKILQTLFKADNIQYTVVCVPGVAQLKTAFTTHHDKVRSVVLINCGGGAKLIELLQPEEHICIFVVDRYNLSLISLPPPPLPLLFAPLSFFPPNLLSLQCQTSRTRQCLQPRPGTVTSFTSDIIATKYR